MEIIQEIIGTRKKQQILLNQEAKKTLQKQIKKNQNRDGSEPPPLTKTTSAFMSLNTQLQLHQQKGIHADTSKQARDESIGYSNREKTYHQQNTTANQSSSKRNGDQAGVQPQDTYNYTHSETALAKNNSSNSRAQQQSQQYASPKQGITGSTKKQTHRDHHNPTSTQSSAQKQLKDHMRVRKVRSKSPPRVDNGKNPAAKIKKFYEGMIPMFTHKKRQHAYYNTAKQGFTYINWDMENELYVFQTQIEQKFRKSSVNKNFVFPRTEQRRDQQKTRGSLEEQQTTQPKQHSKQLLSMAHSKAFSTENVQSKGQSPHDGRAASTEDLKEVMTVDTQQYYQHQPIKQDSVSSEQQPQMERYQIFHPNQNKNKNGDSSGNANGNQSARAINLSSPKTAQIINVANVQKNNRSSVKNNQPGNQLQDTKSKSHYQKSAQKTQVQSLSVAQLKVNSSAQQATSKSVLKPDKESSSMTMAYSQQDLSKPGQNNLNNTLQQSSSQYSNKKVDKYRDKLHSQTSTNSLKLNSNVKQLSAMVKQTSAGASGHQNTHQSNLFSPSQSGGNSRKKQLIQTATVITKGGGGLVSSTSQKTYGLSSINPQTMPTTPLPFNSQSQPSSSQVSQSREKSNKSHSEFQQQSIPSATEFVYIQEGRAIEGKAGTFSFPANFDETSPMHQGQNEPQFRQATTYKSHKNGQQSQQQLHSQNQRTNKAATTQFNNNSANTSQMPSRLNVQTSIDAKEQLSVSAKKAVRLGLNAQTSDLSMQSQSQSTQRLNDSAGAEHNGNNNNVLKFSSEYGTFNTVQLADEMINRSSDYGGGGADSSRQSQKTNPMQLSGIVSPEIQIQSMDHQDFQSSAMGFEPQRMLAAGGSTGNTTKGGSKVYMQMPYGDQPIDRSAQGAKLARSNQSSVNALRKANVGQQSMGVSPTAKKRNIRGQMSSQMQKTSSLNETKKATSKMGNNYNQANSVKAKGLYKTMTKPGAISSQSFIHAPDSATLKTSQGKDAQNRLSSQTPRHVISPEHHGSVQKQLQKTSEAKAESAARGSSGLLTRTPNGKVKGSSGRGQRQQSLNSKEIAGGIKFKADLSFGHALKQYTPGQQKMAPHKVFTGSETKSIRQLSPTAKQKNARSRNAEAGKQTVDNAQKSSKWAEEKPQAQTTFKKGTATESSGKSIYTTSKRANNHNSNNINQSGHSKRQQQYHSRDTEECENFDVKDLDEREPCQAFPTHDLHSTGREQPPLKVPLTTRSTHSLALTNALQTQMTYDINRMSPAQLEESTVSNRGASTRALSRMQRQQTQPQIKYRNEQMKLQGPTAQPLQVNSMRNLHPEYLSGDGSSCEPLGAEPHNKQGGMLYTGTGSASMSELGKRQQAQTLNGFFMEEQYVIKEEKHKPHKKAHGLSGGAKNPRTKSGQLNLMARDFTMQNCQVLKNGQSTKVLNLPPKPSRNSKNNTLVLGNSTGAAARGMQGITLTKAKHFNQQQTMQSTMIMTPKREQFSSTGLFKGFQTRSKAEKLGQGQQQASKRTSFKEQTKQLRYLNKTAERRDQLQNAAANNYRFSINESGSPNAKRLQSAKKVSKVASYEFLQKTIGSGPNHQSISLIQSAQKMPQTPQLNGLNHTAEKRGTKHLYMSLNTEKQAKANHREKSLSVERYATIVQSPVQQYNPITSGKAREKSQQTAQRRGGNQARHDYEIVFDHLNDDSIAEHLSCEMDEQPTVLIVDDLAQHKPNAQQPSPGMAHHSIQKQHKSKERNASLLNASALSREQQIAHPYARSIDPIPLTTSGRVTAKEPRNAPNSEQLPKLSTTDSRLFRQSVGQIQTAHTGAPGHQKGVNSTGLIRDRPGFHKQLSKKASALKLKQAPVGTTIGGGGITTTTQFLNQIQQQQSSNTSFVAQQPGSQLPLNKTQSLVSSQASLQQIVSPVANSLQKQQKLLKTPQNQGTQAQSSTTHQKMLQTYAIAMQGAVAGANARSDTTQSLSHKKTTKKSMIKQ